MDTLITTRPENFKSRIPVRVKSSNLVCKESKICQKLPSLSSNANKMALQNINLSQKDLVKKNHHTEKTSAGKTCKANQICIKAPLVSVNSNKSAAKSSVHQLKAPGTKSCIEKVKVVNAPAVNKCKENKVYKKASSVSQTSATNEISAKKVQKDEKVKNSCCQKEKNVANSKYTYISSKINTQAAETSNGSEKENREADYSSCSSAQKGIKFEANELFRKMILSGREISPSMCKIAPDLRLSSLQAQRPSVYQKFEIHPNPFKEVLEAIANASAKRGTRKISIQTEKKITTLSPFKERNSFYTPCANPREEVMKSLEAFKAKQMQKSALKSSKKKVTFSFNVEEYSAKIDDCDDLERIPSKSSESRLTQINEGSKENTPSSPVRSITETPGVTIESNKEPPVSNVEVEAVILTSDKEKHLHLPTNESSKLCTALTNSAAPSRDVEHVGPSLYSSKKTDSVPSFPDTVCGDIKFIQGTSNSQRTVAQLLFERNTNGQVSKTSQAKLCTPRPISFFPNSRFLNDNTSPEFLAERIPVPSLAPIFTPLALKNMAKGFAISPDSGPVRLKLDFTAEEKDTPKKESANKNPSSTYKNILTGQRVLDDLADQECCVLLLNKSTPVVCDRYLQNPVAVTLTEGDEMHFLPIRI